MLPLALSISSTESVSANANLNVLDEERLIVEVLDLHFKAVVFEPDGSHLHSVIFKEFPDVRLLKLDGIIPDVDLVFRP